MARLIGLLDTPASIPILQSSIMRELSYWLLTGRNGARIARLALPDGHAHRVANAIGIIRADLSRPVRIEELAAAARMSASSLHQHFKLLTALTPLQYRKQLRLLEAPRLMMPGAASVAAAAYRVGRESASSSAANMPGCSARRPGAT